MTRCSAFCLTLDGEHGRRAEAAARKIDRASRGVPIKEYFGPAEILTLPLEEGEGLPVVHGWLGPVARNGEFSMVAHDEEGLIVSRDPGGTRPLYVGASGEWAASDWRFFPDEESRLLPSGSTFAPTTGKEGRDGALVKEFDGSFEEAGRELAVLLDKAIGERVSGTKTVAVAFSGGLDSSLLALCAKRHARVLACTVSSPGSRDSRSAARAADILGAELLREEVDRKKVGRELTEIDLPFESSPMDRSLWCIYSMASRMARDAGAELIMLGQLADELFGGYAKYQRALDGWGPQAGAALMLKDVSRCETRGFLRDEAACSRWLEPRFPFADRRVLELGLGLPVDFKIRRGVRKAVLREAASRLGMPAELISAPKKAAQYSSGIQKIVD